MTAENTSNELVIQGIIKEAFFNETAFEIACATSSITGMLADIIESKIRDQSANKKLCFQTTGEGSFVLNQEYSFQARFHRYTIRGRFQYQGESNGLCQFSFPIKLNLENLRKAERLKVKESQSKSVPVFLRTQAFHCEGSFSLEDTSAQGFGGTLSVPAQFPIEIGTTISGKLGFQEEIAEINGNLVSAVPTSGAAQGSDSYKVGVAQQSAQTPNNESERRKQQRHKTKLQFTLESLLHPGQLLVLDVDDVSVSGFSGIPSQGSIISHVPIGSSFKMSAEGTKVKLVHFSKDRLHFQVVRRSNEDGIAWLKKMAPFVYPGIRCTTRDARELYRIFLQAGAVSTQYLKRHRFHENALIDQDGESKDSHQVHRWFVGGTESEADAYLSALRFGNTCWVMGDIVKADGAEVSAKKAVKGFFQSFSEFALSESSVGTMMIFWVKDHPMWKVWHKKLHSDFKNYICAEIEMQYFRVGNALGTVLDAPTETISNRILEKEDYELRKGVLNSFSPEIERYLKYAFDFDEVGVGSFSMRQADGLFERKYSIVETANAKFLAVVNRARLGQSLNRFVDSLFLVPLTNLDKIENLETEMARIADALSFDFKVTFPAVRLICSKQSEVSGGTEMTCLLLYPRAFFQFN